MTNNNPQYLYELLRKLRNNLAKNANVEPFMVLQNKVLQGIADKQPKTIEELSGIKGLGEKKLAKYGNLILETINGIEDEEMIGDTHEKVFTVYEYIIHLNQILTPQVAVIIGEITSVDDRGNYVFFTIHDKSQEASLKCFIWKNIMNGLGIELKEGMEVKISGFPKIYEKWGSLSFEVQFIGLVGEGALKLAFEKLKKRLDQMGYFALDRKKPFPDYVQTIGLITSQYADAKNDFLTHLGKYGFKIFFYDSRVEGLYALDEITRAIRWFNENLLKVDVLVIVRGGGSLETLQTFNSEAIAKSIYASKIPIITGIGHENDDSIADLVADLRASTPTDAARILSDPWRNVVEYLTQSKEHLTTLFSLNYRNQLSLLINSKTNLFNSVNRFIKNQFNNLSQMQNELGFRFSSIIDKIKSIQIKFLANHDILRRSLSIGRSNLNRLNDSLILESNRWLRNINSNLSVYAEKLNLGSPELRLKQGYSIIFASDDKVIKSSKNLKIGDKLKMKFHQGSATSKVEDIGE